MTAINRILVVDDDALIIEEYLRCLGEDHEPDTAGTTLTELEKVLFGDETDDGGAVRFDVQSSSQGEQAVQAVREAVQVDRPFSVAFVDIKMPPGIDGIEAAKRIREIDPNVNIVIVTGSLSPESSNLGAAVPPADRIFYFKKPFHADECRQLAAALCGKWHSDRALRQANEALEQRVMERTAALHRLAYFDPVTGLPNKLKLVEELQSLIDAAGSGGVQTAVVLLDIERFRFLNETMGYDSGTELLKAIGDRLAEIFYRQGVETQCVVGRFGADEFACLVPVIDGEPVEQNAESVKQAIEKPFDIAGRELHIKASIGVAQYPAHGDDSKTVFQCAEAALHRSMRSPDRRITHYNPAMRYKARHKFELEAELRRAIAAGEIVAHFQPQQCLKTGAVAGIEALARWIRPDGSCMAAADFVPLSEEAGLSDTLFETMLRYVCDTVSRWRTRRPWILPVSVNLSAHQLRHRSLVELIEPILHRHSIDQRLINLELTESVLLEDLTLAGARLWELSDYGVGIHIDDFGTGYSSLSYLAELPVRTIKIDGSFIEHMTESPTTARVVQAIIALGKALGLEVIGEGIETEQQLDALARYGCDFAQGFHIARPLPADEFIRWCESRNLPTAGDAVPAAPGARARV